MNGSKIVEIWGWHSATRIYVCGDLADAVMKAATDLSSLPDLTNCGVGHDPVTTTKLSLMSSVGMGNLRMIYPGL